MLRGACCSISPLLPESVCLILCHLAPNPQGHIGSGESCPGHWKHFIKFYFSRAIFTSATSTILELSLSTHTTRFHMCFYWSLICCSLSVYQLLVLFPTFFRKAAKKTTLCLIISSILTCKTTRQKIPTLIN